MGLFVLLLILVNLSAEIGLVRGRQVRHKLLSELIGMYQDQEVDEYYDQSILQACKTWYTLFMTIVLATGLLALVMPIVVI